MEFTTTEWRSHSAMKASGEIKKGDTKKFLKVIQNLKKLPHGYSVILLDSPGGSVSEALKLSKIIDQFPIHMVIPKDAACASACASILFISGKLRTVEVGGKFGQHSCSIAGVPNKDCNEQIAQNALAHGVSHGSVNAFLTYVAPSDMEWLSRSMVDCHGISRYAFETLSNYERHPEPCAYYLIKGKWPQAQSAWRIDFHADGYKAFVRPVADHDRRLQLNLYCDELNPGILYLSMELQGTVADITRAVLKADFYSRPIIYKNAKFNVSQADQKFTSVTIRIQRRDIIKFLTEANELIFRLSLKAPYKTIFAKTFLSESRQALLFAANNCINNSK